MERGWTKEKNRVSRGQAAGEMLTETKYAQKSALCEGKTGQHRQFTDPSQFPTGW